MNIANSMSTFFCLLLSSFALPHGFLENTLVQDKFDNHWQIINILHALESGQSLSVLSYNQLKKIWSYQKIKTVGFSQANCYCSIILNGDEQHPLQCSPLQLFYRVQDHRWVQAYQLRASDRLLCAHEEVVEVSDIALVHEQASVYTLEVKHTHTFVVGRYHVVAHNMLLPISAAIGCMIPFDIIGCGASAGIAFGPIGICGGILIGSLAGCMVYACTKKHVTEYELSFDVPKITNFIECNKKDEGAKSDDAQVPGKEAIKEDGAKTVDDILKDTVPGEETSGKTKQYVKPGSYEDVMKDFESLRPESIKNIDGKEVKVGILPDGRKVVARLESTYESPTLEIQDGKKRIKIRYDERTN